MLGDLLTDRGHTFELALVGGGALMLSGLMRERSTHDLDVVALVEGDELRSAKPLPAPLREAVTDVAKQLGIADDWLNAGPTALLDFGLPEGFLQRTEVRDYGSLRVRFAARYDQIHFKFYATADRGSGDKHHLDLQRLNPTADELRAAAAWARSHDPSPGFAIIVGDVLASFGVTNDDPASR